MNRRVRFTEQRELRIAIAASEIAEHLIVSAVLLDNVEHVPDWQLEPNVRAETGRAGVDLRRPAGGVSIDVPRIHHPQPPFHDLQPLLPFAPATPHLPPPP